MTPEKPVVLASGCKINVFLHILDRLDTGYHTLESLFLPLSSPCDEVRVFRVSRKGLAFSCSDAALEGPENTIAKAYAAFAAVTGYAPGLEVFLQKNIPYGAGLGGGSANAAVFLLWLNAAARQDGETGLEEAALHAVAAKVGADAPFFLKNLPCMVRGFGDIIEPAPNPLSGMRLVLVCPRVHISTAWAFAAWDAKNLEKHAPLALTKKNEKDTSPFVRGIRVCNDLAPVVFEKHPELEKIVAALYDCNATAASMSGSGSSIFGLFEDESDAEQAVRRFRNAGERVFVHVL